MTQKDYVNANRSILRKNKQLPHEEHHSWQSLMGQPAALASETCERPVFKYYKILIKNTELTTPCDSSYLQHSVQYVPISILLHPDYNKASTDSFCKMFSHHDYRMQFNVYKRKY